MTDRYCYLRGWWAVNLQIKMALFPNDLLDSGDELMQYPDKPISYANPKMIIRSSPRDDGFVFVYTINLIPEDMSIDELPMDSMWTLTHEAGAERVEKEKEKAEYVYEDYDFSL